eukprot:scaffold73191_cov68-Phaeocystis_antarctica.AAC.2
MRESISVRVPADMQSPPPLFIVARQRRMATRVSVCVPWRWRTRDALKQSEKLLSIQVLEPNKWTAPPSPDVNDVNSVESHLATRTRLACSMEPMFCEMAPPLYPILQSSKLTSTRDTSPFSRRMPPPNIALQPCTPHLHGLTHGKEPAAVSSAGGVAVADSATAHDKGALNTDATAAATYRIGETVGDEHVGKRKDAVRSHVCAPPFSFRAAPRDAASDHGETPVPEFEAACIAV